MFCPKCGKELPEGARFCTACGTPLNPVPAAEEPVYKEPVQEVQEPSYDQNYDQNPDPSYEQDHYDQGQYDGYDDYYEEAPAPKKSLKPLIITLAIIAAAAVVGLVLYFTVFKNAGGSGDDLETAQTRTFNALAERSEATAILKDANTFEKLGVNVKIDSLGDVLSLYNSYMSMIDIEAEMDVAMDKDGNASVTIDANGMGMEATAGFYKTSEGDGDIVVSIPEFLDDVYGISLATLADDLDDSIFNPDNDTYYSIPDYMYNSYKASFEAIAAALKSVSPDVMNKLKEELNSNEDSKIEFEKTKEKVEIGGEEVSCTVYKGTIDTDKIISIMEVVGDWIDENEEMEGLITIISNLSGNAGMTTSKMIKEATKELEDIDIDLDLEYDVCKGYLARAYLSGKVDGEKVKAEFNFGADPATTEEMSAVIKLADMDFKVTVDLSKVDKNEISAVLESDAEDLYFEFNFAYDEKDKSFEFTAENDYRSFLIEGGMEISEDTLIITDPAFYRNDEEMFSIEGVTITFTKNPTIKTLKGDYPDGYVNILSLDEDEFGELGELIQNLMDVIG